MAGQKKEVDWQTLALDYRAGVKSMRLLSSEYGISTARIGQVADDRGWSRDLAAKIRARTQAKLESSILDGILDTEKSIAESDVVEANAQMQTCTIRQHRADIARSLALAMSLLEELEISTGDNALLRDLGRLMHAPDANGNDKLNQIYRKVITFPNRVDAMKKLSDILKVLIALERGAFGIDRKEADTGGAIDSLIKRVLIRQRSDCF